MKIIEVPIYNDDGSVQFTASLGPEEAQTLLQFGANMAIAMGIASQMGIGLMEQGDNEDVEYDD